MKDVPDLPTNVGGRLPDDEPPTPMTLDRWAELRGITPDQIEVVEQTPTGDTGEDVQAPEPVEASRDVSGGHHRVGDYLAREVPHTGMTDVDLLHRLRDDDMPILLYGPPGTGKTAMARAACGDDLVTIVGTVDTDTSDLVGSWVPTGNPSAPYVWVDGPLTVAVRNGRPLLVDEIALIDPRVLSTLYALMDGRDTLFLPSNPAEGEIRVADGFYVIGACNPDAPGAVMSEALLSRFTVHLYVPTPYDMLTHLGVDEDIILAAQNLHALSLSHEIRFPPQTRELLAFTRVRRSIGLQAALSNLVGTARPSDRKRYAEVLTMSFGREVRPLGD